MCVFEHICYNIYIEGFEDSFQELVIAFHLWDLRTELRFGCIPLYLMSHLAGLLSFKKTFTKSQQNISKLFLTGQEAQGKGSDKSGMDKSKCYSQIGYWLTGLDWLSDSAASTLS